MKNENLNIMFVDAFLNLTIRVLNLEVTYLVNYVLCLISMFLKSNVFKKNLLSKDFCKSLAAKSTIFVNKEAKMKQTHKSRFTNLIHRCEIICKSTS